MRKALLKLFIAVIISAIHTQGYPKVQADALVSSSPQILVGLIEASQVSVNTPLKTYLESFEGARVTVERDRDIRLSYSEGKIFWEIICSRQLEASGVSSGPLFIRGSHDNSGSFLQVGPVEGGWDNLSGMSFSGDFVAIPRDGKVFLVNAVDMERYVRSVVSTEMPHNWPIESLKAQAIACRSYALHRCQGSEESMSKSGYSDGFRTLTPESVKISWSDQIYKGITVERPNAVTATLSTQGIVMVYDGSVVSAYYHADAGGMTEDARYVWGGWQPYLVPVEEILHESPYSDWRVSFDVSSLSTALQLAGAECVEVVGQEPGGSGRWSKVLVTTTNGHTLLRGNDFRLKTGLRSLLFSSYRVGGNVETLGHLSSNLDVCVTNGNTMAKVKPGDVTIQGATSIVSNVQCAAAISLPQAAPTTFIFEGKGWGHGVGMSQWGARAMAEQGLTSEAILMHYYPGIVLEKWY